MRLTYWVSMLLDGSPSYSVRAKTLKSAREMLKSFPDTSYGPIVKVSVEYKDALDLLNKCLTEDSGYWEC